MKNKFQIVLALIVVFAITQACVVPNLLAVATPTPTETATLAPSSTPTSTPTTTPTLAPTANPCTDLQNRSYAYNDNLILKDFQKVDADVLKHFPGNGKIITEG